MCFCLQTGREVTEANVEFTLLTDQDGDFRVGDLFRVEQSTGVATLNADALTHQD